MNAIAASLSNSFVQFPIPPAPEPLAETAPPRPRVWTTLVAWTLAATAAQIVVLVCLVTAIVGISLSLREPGDDFAAILPRAQAVLQQPLPAVLLTIVPFQLTLFAVTGIAARMSKESFAERVGLLPASGRKMSALGLAALAGFTAASALLIVVGSSMLFGPVATGSVDTAMPERSWLSIAIVGTILTTLPALVEEIVFRGFLQRRLLQRWSPRVAVAVSTALFATLHADSLQHILAVVPLGAVTGIVAWRTNSVKPGMLLHAIHNAGVVVFGALAAELSPRIGDENLGLLTIGVVAALILLGLPAVFSLTRSERIEDDRRPVIAPRPTAELAGVN